MDGRVVGRGGLALRLHVVSQGRALPLAWRVRHSPTGPCPRGTPHRRGRTAALVAPRGGHGDRSGRRRVRWDRASGHPARDGLVLRVPYGHAHDGAVGGRDVSPRCVRRVSPAGAADGGKRGLCHTRGVWPNPGTVLLGHGGSRAPVSGAQPGDSRGGVPLVAQALPHRDLFFRPAKPRLPSSAVAYRRPSASFSVLHSGVCRFAQIWR
jgi:hypothetical protein